MINSIGKINGIIIGYARGSNTQYNNYVLIELKIDNSYVNGLISKKIIITDKYGNKYYGKIIKRHSRRKPVVEACFKPNIPGQLIGTECTVF